jgi:uncharacterized protein (TIGR01777 family)
MGRRFVIAGGRGFLGMALARDLAGRGEEVVLLSRRPAPPEGTIRTVTWDGRAVGAWAGELAGAAALVNFTGRSVACLYTPENRREIIASRVDSVAALAAALAVCPRPPPVWVQASSLAIYGDPGDRVCDEAAPAAEGFSAGVCRTWEQEFFSRAVPAGTRRVALRIGFVLGRNGGALEPLARLARWFLGGTVGHGRQYISWIEIADFCSVCRWVIERPDAQGIYNVTGPVPATNADFMREVRRALGRPWSPPAPAWAVSLGARWLMRADPSLALTGRRCVPRRLAEEGFRFQHPDLRSTLRGLLG